MPTPSPDWGLESLQSEGWSWAEPFRIWFTLPGDFLYLIYIFGGSPPSAISLTLLTLFMNGGRVVKTLPARARDTRDMGLTPESGKSPGGGNGNVIQYSCLENSMDTGAWRATVHGVTKSRTRLSTDTHMDSHCCSLCSLNTWSPLTCFYSRLCSRWIYLSFPWERKMVCSRAWPIFSGLLLGVDCYTELWEFYFTGQFSRKLDLSTLMKVI